MATRYGVQWTDATGQARRATWAFREGAMAFWAALCDLEREGCGVTGATLQHYGPNGERWESENMAPRPESVSIRTLPGGDCEGGNDV